MVKKWLSALAAAFVCLAASAPARDVLSPAGFSRITGSNLILAEILPVLKIALLVLAIIAICAIAMAILFWLTHWAHKLAPPGNPAHPAAPTPTQPIRTCPRCGAALNPDAPEGLCPACLLQHGLATEGAAPPGAPPFTPPPLQELAKLFPQLEILESIGQGGMGAVYKARQPALDRFVALKILAPRSGGDLDFAGRFSREARALAKLSHPNIVAVYDFGQIANPSGANPSNPDARPLSYFIMEYVDGPNLRQLERAGKLTPREALQIIPQICAALQFAHDEGIVHRDIKPENVLLDKKGRVKIADFGLAKILGQQADVRLTGARDVMGTPHYMAPEQVEKPQEVDHRADIYSLGVVFYEMLTGELPLGKFDPPSHKVQIDVRLDDVVLRSLANNPERRYQHVSEVKTDLENIAEHPSRRATGAPFASTAGIDYRSKQTLFGLPLVHITSGIDPLTGKVRVSKGIIAIGGHAQGVIAIGGMAYGGLAIGGLAVGGVAFGGCALGILSFGGLAIALLFGLGGGVIAPVAMGGAVIGVMAFGGAGLGAHVLAGNAQDAMAQRFFGEWAHFLMNHFQFINTTIILAAIGFGVGVPLWTRKRIQSQDNARILDRVYAWLALMDAGNYAAGWESAAPYFQRAVAREEWVGKSNKIRHPLGAVVSRRLRYGRFTGDGSRFEAKFDTDFDGMRAAVETITFTQQSNGDWQADGYFIKPTSSDSFRRWLWPVAAGMLLAMFFVCFAYAVGFPHQAVAPLMMMGLVLVGLIVSLGYCASLGHSRLWIWPAAAIPVFLFTLAIAIIASTKPASPADSVTERRVDRPVMDFPETPDFSTPEGTYAAWARAAARMDANALNRMQLDPPGPQRYLDWFEREQKRDTVGTTVYREAKILLVQTWQDDLANVIAEVPHPANARLGHYCCLILARTNGTWKEFSDELCADLKTAKSSFNTNKKWFWQGALEELSGENNVIVSVHGYSRSTSIDGFAKPTSRLIFSIGGQEVWSTGFRDETSFTGELERAGRGLRCHVVDSIGMVLLDMTAEDQLGPANFNQGDIRFVEGDFHPGPGNGTNAASSFTLGYFQPENGPALPIEVKLSTAQASVQIERGSLPASTIPQSEALLFAKQPPVVVETFPASGARDVPPGETEIRVRFSKPMEDGSWNWSTAWENSAPESIGAPHYLADQRTCVIKVRLEPGHTYAWWLNSGSSTNFKDQAGLPAVPYLLTFETSR